MMIPHQCLDCKPPPVGLGCCHCYRTLLTGLTAEGWGAFTQKRTGQAQQQSLALAAGRLRLRTLAFATPDGLRPAKATLSLNGKPLPATLTAKPGRAEITLADELLLQAGERLEIVLDG